MVKLELSKDEIRTLQGVLLVEQYDLTELIEKADNAKDKQELEKELINVESIINKIKK